MPKDHSDWEFPVIIAGTTLGAISMFAFCCYCYYRRYSSKAAAASASKHSFSPSPRASDGVELSDLTTTHPSPQSSASSSAVPSAPTTPNIGSISIRINPSRFFSLAQGAMPEPIPLVLAGAGSSSSPEFPQAAEDPDAEVGSSDPIRNHPDVFEVCP